MNKRFFILSFSISLLILSLILILVQATKYSNLTKYGKFYKAGTLNYTHDYSDVIKLSENDILVLGNDFNNIPSELYNTISNKTKIYEFDKNIRIHGEGLALKDNNILLLNTCNLNSSNCKDYKDYAGNIIIYNTKSQKIVNSYSLNKDNQYLFIYDYFALNNGNIFFIVSYQYLGQDVKFYYIIYNPQKNSVEISKSATKLLNPKGIQINDKKVLIFQDNSKILVYDISTKKVSETNSKNSLYNSCYTKIGNHILILGTSTWGYENTYNELYNFENDKIINIDKMVFERTYALLDQNGKSRYQTLPINSTQVLITGGRKPSLTVGTPIASSEIYDLEKNMFMSINNSKYIHASHRMIKLNNQEILLISGKTDKSINSNKSMVEKFKKE